MWITSNAVESFSADTQEKYKDVYLVIYIGYMVVNFSVEM